MTHSTPNRPHKFPEQPKINKSIGKKISDSMTSKYWHFSKESIEYFHT